MIGIIGGTGFYNANFLENVEEITVETAYGDREINLGLIEEEKVVFLPRHGPTHSIPPHMVDYRKNIQALKNSGAKRLISINSVGSLDKSITPGSILLPHDFIDLTWGRNSTFYDNEVEFTPAHRVPDLRLILKLRCSRRWAVMWLGWLAVPRLLLQGRQGYATPQSAQLLTLEVGFQRHPSIWKRSNQF
jgi:purine nucleoside phosphorylase